MKQTHRYREQTSGYKWREGRWEGPFSGRGLKGARYYDRIIKLQGYIVQHGKYRQYFIITINGV